MNIRYVCSDVERGTDAALAAVADRATRAGIALAGTVQPVDPDTAQVHCDITLALLPDGERRNISFPLQPNVTGCRLNAEALEDAVSIVHQRLAAAHGLVVNKFGKQEIAGRGLVAAIAEACARELPVLIGVAPQYLANFLAFADGRAEPLPADDPLWDAPNLYLSPHTSTSLDRYADNLVDLAGDNLTRFAEAQPLRNEVDLTDRRVGNGRSLRG